MRRLFQDTIQQRTGEEVAKKRPASRILSGGEAVRDCQEHRAVKESEHPSEDQSGEQAKKGTRSRASTSDKLAEVLSVIQIQILKTVPNTKFGSDNDPTGKDQSV